MKHFRLELFNISTISELARLGGAECYTSKLSSDIFYKSEWNLVTYRKNHKPFWLLVIVEFLMRLL